MDIEYILGPNGELYHSGIKGMKWGIRRYQNKDGSLTPAGRKRYNKEMDQLKAREKDIKGREKAKARQAKLDAKKAELDEREKALKTDEDSKKKTSKISSKDASNKPKSISEMSDEELRNKVMRLQNERMAMDLERQIANMNPKQVSKGEKFVKGIVDAAVPKLTNAVADVAANYVKKKVSEALGVDKKDIDEVDKVAKDAKYWINKNQLDKNKREYEERQAKDKAEADAATAKKKAEEESTKKAERDRKAEEDIERRMNEIDQKNAREKAEREAPLTGTVEGTGDSRKSSGNENSKKQETVIIDMDDYVSSSSVTDLVPAGRDYINRLLLEDGDD